MSYCSRTLEISIVPPDEIRFEYCKLHTHNRKNLLLSPALDLNSAKVTTTAGQTSSVLSYLKSMDITQPSCPSHFLLIVSGILAHAHDR